MGQLESVGAPLSERDVAEGERAAIERRREVAGLEHQPSFPAPGTPDEIHFARVAELEPIGLAISGGGARSAAFGLGLMQAFHRFGLLRFVDYLSAVSGGTYAAGMFARSFDTTQPYGRHNCDLAQEPNGRSSPFVRSAAQRGNSLFRVDLFLARFVPNFVLNLLPRLCLLIAIGSGIAWLWRMLDLHAVRRYLEALGLNDTGAAFLPSTVLGTLWAIVFVLAISLQSIPLRRWSVALLTLTAASLLTGAAVLIGNGDVTFTREYTAHGDESRVTWLSELWMPLASVVALGCVPLLFPQKLLRSGTQPRNWVDSWVFYYVSIALTIGIPLVAVGYFARENISGFNEARGPALLRADLEDEEALTRLLTDSAAGDPVIVPELNLQIRPSLYALAGPSLIDDLDALETQRLRSEAARRELRLSGEFPGPPKPPGVEVSQAFLPVVGNSHDETAWTRFKYLRVFDVRLRELLRFLVNGAAEHGPYGDLIEADREHAEIRDSVLTRLNQALRTAPGFTFSRMEDRTSFITDRDKPPKLRELSPLSPKLREQLQQVALVLNAGTTNRGRPALPEFPQLASLNRNLLEAIFPDIIRARSEIRRVNLITHDQWHRFVWFAGSLTLALLLGWWIDPNRTGLHGFYRDRLAATYLMRKEPERVEVYPEIERIPLSSLACHQNGAPCLLFNASTLMRQPWKHADQLQTPFATFLLSQQFCGNSTLGFSRTAELGKREPGLADAIAISGGALDPAYFVHHILTVMMGVVNFRMGQLFPNPRRPAAAAASPSMLRVAWQSLRQLQSGDCEITGADDVLLTDGGHAENLGLEALLLRRCRLIIVSDAGHDPQHTLDDLAKVVRRLETTHGIRIAEIAPPRDDASAADGQPLRVPRNMAPPIYAAGKDERESLQRRDELLDKLFTTPAQSRHFFVAKILYPECGSANNQGVSERPEFEGRLIYIKPCLTGDEGLQLQNYARRNVHFPHESTLDQAFEEAQFEAYRRLGFHSGCDLCRELPDPDAPGAAAGENLWDATRLHVRTLTRKLVDAAAFPEATPAPELRDRVERLLQELAAGGKETETLNELASHEPQLMYAVDLLVRHAANHPEASEYDWIRKAVRELDDRAAEPLLKFIRAEPDLQSPGARLALEWLEDVPDGNWLRDAIPFIRAAAVKSDATHGLRLVHWLQRLRHRSRKNSTRHRELAAALAAIAKEAKDPDVSRAAHTAADAGSSSKS